MMVYKADKLMLCCKLAHHFDKIPFVLSYHSQEQYVYCYNTMLTYLESNQTYENY